MRKLRIVNFKLQIEEQIDKGREALGETSITDLHPPKGLSCQSRALPPFEKGIEGNAPKMD